MGGERYSARADAFPRRRCPEDRRCKRYYQPGRLRTLCDRGPRIDHRSESAVGSSDQQEAARSAGARGHSRLSLTHLTAGRGTKTAYAQRGNNRARKVLMTTALTSESIQALQFITELFA